MTQPSLSELLDKALASRATLFDARHEFAFRLFNGFSEGNPNLVVDLYAKTILFHNYADAPEQTLSLIQEAKSFIKVICRGSRRELSKRETQNPLKKNVENFYSAMK